MSPTAALSSGKKASELTANKTVQISDSTARLKELSGKKRVLSSVMAVIWSGEHLAAIPGV